MAAQYYKSRLLRIVPSYYATLLLIYSAVLPLLSALNKGPEAGRSKGWGSEGSRAIATLWFNPGDGCPGKLWANFLFANNQLQRAGCMKYAWSQAVQVCQPPIPPFCVMYSCMHACMPVFFQHASLIAASDLL